MRYSVNRMRTLKKLPLCILVLIFIFSMQSCFKEVVKTKPLLPDIIWPNPPEIPRIRFIDSISGPGDLNAEQTMFRKLLVFLKGDKNIFKSIVNVSHSR